MKPVFALAEKEPLPAQAEKFLLRGCKDTPIRLGDTLVPIPAARAGRAIRRELSKKEVFSPRFCLPLDALLPAGIAAASRLEREIARAKLHPRLSRLRLRRRAPHGPRFAA